MSESEGNTSSIDLPLRLLYIGTFISSTCRILDYCVDIPNRYQDTLNYTMGAGGIIATVGAIPVLLSCVSSTNSEFKSKSD